MIRAIWWLGVIVALCSMCGCSGPSHAASSTTAASPYPSLDSQIASCNASASCSISIPVGTFVFSTAIAPQAMFRIRGAGASFDNPGIPTTAQYPTVETHCLTRLIWQGGTQTPIKISSYHLQGSSVGGFCLDSTGSPDTFIDVDNFAGGVTISDLVIDAPQSQARIAAIRYGGSALVVDEICRNVFVRGAAPIGFDVVQVQAHFVGDHCRAVWNQKNEWVIGDTHHAVESFHCLFCTAEARPGNVALEINNAIGLWWSEGYFECGGAPTGYCVEIPASGTQARSVTIQNNFVGGDSSLPGATGFVHSALPVAILTITGNQIDYVFSSPGYILQNDAVAHATIVGNTMLSAGSAVASNPQNVCSLGNVTSVPSTGGSC